MPRININYMQRRDTFSRTFNIRIWIDPSKYRSPIPICLRDKDRVVEIVCQYLGVVIDIFDGEGDENNDNGVSKVGSVESSVCLIAEGKATSIRLDEIIGIGRHSFLSHFDNKFGLTRNWVLTKQFVILEMCIINHMVLYVETAFLKEEVLLSSFRTAYRMIFSTEFLHYSLD